MYVSNTKLIDLNKLLKISRSRLKVLERLLKQSQQEYTKSTVALQERLNCICNINNKIHSIREYMTLESVISSPEKMNRADAYLFWLKYDLEMHEYYRKQEEASLEERKNNYISARDNWYKQRKKSEKLNDIYVQHKHIERHRIEELEGEAVYENILTKDSI